MIIIIRGHLRESFDNPDLFFLIKAIHEIEPTNLKIYIHTWNIFANNLSWREINENNTTVTKDTINEYFGELQHLIKDILIDDDKNIQLIGITEGSIHAGGGMQRLGWKNYWYGKHKIVEHIKNKTAHSDANADEMIVNFRFDVLNNSNNFTQAQIVDFIKTNQNARITKNIFICHQHHCGIDNIYMGNIDTMYKITRHFCYCLDEILTMFYDIRPHVRLIYLVNDYLFPITNQTPLTCM